MNLLTVTFTQRNEIHVTVDLDAGTVLGEPEVENEPPEAEIVRDENGLRATTEEAIKAIAIVEATLKPKEVPPSLTPKS